MSTTALSATAPFQGLLQPGRLGFARAAGKSIAPVTLAAVVVVPVVVLAVVLLLIGDIPVRP